MLDFNTISIKGSDDLQQALLVEHDVTQFAYQFKSMIDRWGLDSALQMLGHALYGDDEKLEPLIRFKKRIVIENWDDPNDTGYLVEIS